MRGLAAFTAGFGSALRIVFEIAARIAAAFAAAFGTQVLRVTAIIGGVCHCDLSFRRLLNEHVQHEYARGARIKFRDSFRHGL